MQPLTHNSLGQLFSLDLDGLLIEASDEVLEQLLSASGLLQLVLDESLDIYHPGVVNGVHDHLECSGDIGEFHGERGGNTQAQGLLKELLYHIYYR